MLSACASVNRGMEAVLAAERAADREMMANVAQRKRQSQYQHAALKAAGSRLESQSEALQRQQAAIARLATALNGPSGLQDRLTDMQDALRRIVAELAVIEAGTRARAEVVAGDPPVARAPGRRGGGASGDAAAVPTRR
ncbi:MAG: hypothetical protein ACRYGL_10990 [Janthinobacterium lividum]